jgi:hypothetical protein
MIVRGDRMKDCPECYSSNNRATPLLKPKECLENHAQYICGTCGRCICIETDKKRLLQRWNFPFKSVEIAKLYLRTADFTKNQSCGIYEIISNSGRKSYKIFPNKEDYINYLKKNNKTSTTLNTLFQKDKFQLFPNTQIRKLNTKEIHNYLNKQSIK